ncbi:MAG TPA: hypothetical protein VKR58_12015, partial [Aquella sp.]|nr:hypothetical protein [Aquella sp.]
MDLARVFTEKPDSMVWNKRDAKITDSNGNIVFELKDVEAPASWSDNAVNIVASKYFKKINGIQETSVKQLIERVVKTITNWGLDCGYFTDPDTNLGDYPADVFKEELTWILTNQYACFNSPIWFNFGVPGREQQAAACFLIGLEDNSESIRNWSTVESKIFKGGSGSGVNVSPLRGEKAP